MKKTILISTTILFGVLLIGGCSNNIPKKPNQQYYKLNEEIKKDENNNPPKWIYDQKKNYIIEMEKMNILGSKDFQMEQIKKRIKKNSVIVDYWRDFYSEKLYVYIKEKN